MCRTQVPLHRPYPRTAWQHSEEARARDRLAICEHKLYASTSYMRAQAICEHKLIYSYICVLVLLCVHARLHLSSYCYMCPDTTICVLILLYMCPHTISWAAERETGELYASTTCYMCRRTTTCVLIPLYMCPHFTVCVRILLYMSSYYYMCPHTTIYVSSYYYMCPHTTILIRGRGSVKHAYVCWRMLTYANVC